ncbi:GGDEF domain-containing protein [Pseudonocardia parietis]|uniref:Diguanylate cyclase (GGDEF)-like protein n=1 Tax=Pseudonocardia parietis TaxID=570936 RepID=A0ABS4VZL0_9PSEU|nr:GGDEF domain-containing protein [Pseudonocardia parietis]MBP2369221.1 diguanylate cyclase (GGDEF)-like protein [Pseudonocardia parietis]
MTASRSRGGPASWPVRQLPRPMIVVLVAVVTGAAALVVTGAVLLPADRSTGAAALGALGLVALGVLHTELATGIERVRRRVAHASYFDLSSVWTFAGALLLPPALAGLVVVGIYGHLWWRVWRPAGAALYRHVYTTGTVVLAAYAAATLAAPERLTVASGAGEGSMAAGFGALLLAMLVYVLVNQTLVALALSLTTGRRFAWRGVLGDWDDHVLEGATLCLAVLAALAAMRQPLLVLLVLPPLLVLHRAVLIRQLEERANTDAKTGLLTAAAWRGRAHRALARTRRQQGAVAVLILDLDHFKSVNDGYGHLAGDEVLAAVAGALSAQVRDVDPVGRFGGEEFVVLLAELPGGPPGRELAHAAAERIRSTVRGLAVHIDAPGGPLTITDLSVSVGVAVSGPDGDSLDELMQVADYALYAAKRAGRNRVRLGRRAVTEPGPEA